VENTIYKNNTVLAQIKPVLEGMNGEVFQSVGHSVPLGTLEKSHDSYSLVKQLVKQPQHVKQQLSFSAALPWRIKGFV